MRSIAEPGYRTLSVSNIIILDSSPSILHHSVTQGCRVCSKTLCAVILQLKPFGLTTSVATYLRAFPAFSIYSSSSSIFLFQLIIRFKIRFCRIGIRINGKTYLGKFSAVKYVSSLKFFALVTFTSSLLLLQ